MSWYDDAVEYWLETKRNRKYGRGIDHRIGTLRKLRRRCGSALPSLLDVVLVFYRYVKTPPTVSHHGVKRFIWDVFTTPQLSHLPPYGASVLRVDYGVDVPSFVEKIRDPSVMAYAVIVWLSDLRRSEVADITIEYYNGHVRHKLPVWAAEIVDKHIERVRRFGLLDSEPLFPVGLFKYLGKKRPDTAYSKAVGALRTITGVDSYKLSRSLRAYKGVPRYGKYRYGIAKNGRVSGDGQRTMLYGTVKRFGDQFVFIVSLDRNGAAVCARPDGSLLSAHLSELESVVPSAEVPRSVVEQAIENGVYVSNRTRRAVGAPLEDRKL